MALALGTCGGGGGGGSPATGDGGGDTPTVPRSLVAINIFPDPARVPTDGTLQMMAEGLYDDNTSEQITPEWLSANSGAATIDGTGLARGGCDRPSTDITATFDGVVAVVTLEISGRELICPIPGNSGQFIVSGIASDGFTLQWERATDAQDPASALEYMLYTSDANNLVTLPMVEANGTAIGTFTANIDQHVISGLTADATRYYNVIVRDSDGAKVSYRMIEETTLPVGRQMERRDTGLPAANITSITVHPSDRNTVFVTFSSFGVPHLWRTGDGGGSWVALDGSGPTGIPDIPSHTLFIDPLDTNHLYLGTDLGVLFSADGGSNWESINMNGMANVIVERLAYQASTRRLFAFTHGRGVFRVTLP